MATVRGEQRYSKSRPCPICGGHDHTARHQQIRCFGFLTEDGVWAFCTREEHAGGLQFIDQVNGYRHTLVEDCACGAVHLRASGPVGEPSSIARSSVKFRWTYVDPEGNPRFRVCRTGDQRNGGKSYFLERYDRKAQQWLAGLGDEPWRLYREDKIVDSPLDEVIHIAEGERCAGALSKEGFVATTNPSGAGKWREEYSEQLRGHPVVIYVDNDIPGHRHAEQVANSLSGKVPEIKVVKFDGTPPGYDIADWLHDSHGKSDILKRIAETPVWSPSTSVEASSGPGIPIIKASDVAVKTVEWLVEGLIPRAMITVVMGQPNEGKTTVLLDIAARLSTGVALPTEDVGPLTGTLFVSGEDSNEVTLRPRLERQQADLQRIAFPDLRDGGVLTVSRFYELEQAVIENDIGLIVIDPLFSFLESSAIDNVKIRAAMAVLKGIAERTGAAVVLITHPNKNAAAGHVLHRSSGALDTVAQARSVIIVGREDDDPDKRIVCQVKSNLGPECPAYRFHFSSDGTLEWDGEAVDIDPNALLNHSGRPSRAKRDDAIMFLEALLEAEPVGKAQVEDEAHRAGHSERTIRRAAEELGITQAAGTIYRKGGHWFWKLPVSGDQHGHH